MIWMRSEKNALEGKGRKNWLEIDTAIFAAWETLKDIYFTEHLDFR